MDSELKSKFPKLIINKIDIQPLNRVDLEINNENIKNLSILNRKKDNGNLKVTIDKNGISKTLFFKFNIKAKIPALIATRDIPAKKLLNLNDFTKEFIQFDEFTDGVLDDFPKHSLISKQLIKKGKILNQRNFKIPYDIQKGDKIQAILKDNSLSLKVFVTALSSGNLGDEIEILTKDKKKIKAKIISKKEVILK